MGFPAFCPECGLIFEGRSLVVEGSVRNITVRGSKETCPRCGAWAELPDGTFDVVGDTIRVLSASKLTRERLRRLQVVLEAAQAGEASPAKVAAVVADTAPELRPLFERYSPLMRKALYAFLSMVIATLLAQGVAELRDDSATRADVRQAVEEALQHHHPPPGAPEPTPAQAPRPQITKTHTGRKLDLHILAVRADAGGTLKGLHFQRCVLAGPAVLLIQERVDFLGCSYAMDAWWRPHPQDRFIRGVIGVSDCIFDSCTFDGSVGFLGDDELIEMVRANTKTT